MAAWPVGGRSNLSLDSIGALFLAMALLAALPSVSVMAVVARAASYGFVHGAVTALGVAAGDILLILLAIYGLVLLTEVLGELVWLVNYAGGLYLIWLGISVWKSGSKAAGRGSLSGSSLASGFLSGLLITLGDQKAIFFYLGFLPAFLNLTALSHLDIALVVCIAAVAVGGVKLAYACLAGRAGVLLNARAGVAVNIIAACVLIAAGAAVIARAWSS